MGRPEMHFILFIAHCNMFSTFRMHADEWLVGRLVRVKKTFLILLKACQIEINQKMRVWEMHKRKNVFLRSLKCWIYWAFALSLIQLKVPYDSNSLQYYNSKYRCIRIKSAWLRKLHHLINSLQFIILTIRTFNRTPHSDSNKVGVWDERACGLWIIKINFVENRFLCARPQMRWKNWKK